VLGPLQYSVPTINFLLGWLAYNESLDGTKVVGFAIVWVALAVLGVDTYRRSVSSTGRYRR
jgi:chloramphenicol-sensitive protein RarD